MRPEEKRRAITIGAISSVVMAILFPLCAALGPTHYRWGLLAASGAMFGIGFGIAARLMIIARRRAREGDPVKEEWKILLWWLPVMAVAVALAGLA